MKAKLARSLSLVAVALALLSIVSPTTSTAETQKDKFSSLFPTSPNASKAISQLSSLPQTPYITHKLIIGAAEKAAGKRLPVPIEHGIKTVIDRDPTTYVVWYGTASPNRHHEDRFYLDLPMVSGPFSLIAFIEVIDEADKTRTEYSDVGVDGKLDSLTKWKGNYAVNWAFRLPGEGYWNTPIRGAQPRYDSVIKWIERFVADQHFTPQMEEFLNRPSKSR